MLLLMLLQLLLFFSVRFLLVNAVVGFNCQRDP
jgi:hypothetical protein